MPEGNHGTLPSPVSLQLAEVVAQGHWWQLSTEAVPW